MEDLMTKKDLAVRLKISEKLVDRLVSRKQIGFSRISGRLVRFTEKHYQSFIKKGEVVA